MATTLKDKIAANIEDVKAIRALFTRPVFDYEQEKAINEYKVEKHDVFDPAVRKNKAINKGTGQINKATGKEATTPESVPVARIGLSFQQLIVDRRVGFTLTIPVEIEPIYEGDKETDKEKNLVNLTKRILNDNKMEYKNKDILRRMISEMEVAECWYLAESGKDKPKFTLKCNIWSKDLGDTLYPMFDAYGDMIAFAREYKLKEGSKDIEHFDIYLPELEYKFVNRDNVWKLDDQLMNAAGQSVPNPKVNEIGKIAIVYHSQKRPEWADAATAISRLETSISNHADMNDYFGSPILTVIGEILGFAGKGEQGKILQLTDDVKNAQAKFLELNSKPESIQMEQDNLRQFIHNLTQTPDISFETMKGMGTIAQFTMKAFFMDAHMAVSRKEEIFGIGLQRRFNIIKAAIGKVIDTSLSNEAENVQLLPKITPYLPQNDSEVIENLSVARTGGIISTESAIEQNPLVKDSDVEKERIKDDETKELAGDEPIPVKGLKSVK
jgi:SPP1 family phage portal protein